MDYGGSPEYNGQRHESVIRDKRLAAMVMGSFDLTVYGAATAALAIDGWISVTSGAGSGFVGSEYYEYSEAHDVGLLVSIIRCVTTE